MEPALHLVYPPQGDPRHTLRVPQVWKQVKKPAFLAEISAKWEGSDPIRLEMHFFLKKRSVLK